MKRFLFTSLTLTACLMASAVPAKRGSLNVTQPDGSVITVNRTGDEFGHYYLNSKGEPVARDASGKLVPASASTIAQLKSQAKNRRGSRNMAIRRAAAENNSQVPHIGKIKVPVLLVQYSDYKFKDADPKATFTNFFESGSKSAHQYFYDQSNGKFDAQFDVYGPITLSGTRETYGGNDKWGYDVGVGNMVGEACQGLDSSINFSQYDNDGDGECDVVIVLYAGDGEASSYDKDCENSVWPCQWDLSSSEFGRSLRLDNTKVNLFAVFNELNGSDLTKIDGVGTFCHEFSHCLGLPDFYDTQYGPHFGMADWSLMDYGSYNDDGYTPVGYSAYEKEFMGWIEIPEAKENTHYTLTSMNLKSLDTDQAVKLTNAADPDEYYIFENRQQKGWDAYMPAKGLLITHFTYDASVWEANTVNDEDLQHATLIPADNDLKLDKVGSNYYINEKSLLTDLWPQANATELTDTSVPAAKVNTGKYMSKPITEIVQNADGTVSFWAMKSPLPRLDTPVNLSHKVIDSNTIEVAWECTDSNVGSYTLEVAPYIENQYTLLKKVDFTGTHGWSTSGYTGVEDGALRFGSGKQQGSVTSPAYKSEDDHDCVTVILNAKDYSTDGSSIKVSLLTASGSTIQTKTVELTSLYKDYVVNFPLAGGSQFKIKIETTAIKKRFYVTTAQIYSGDATDIINADNAPQRRVAEAKRTFTGITDTKYMVSGLTANGAYTYRVMAVPADADSYANSAWTVPVLFNLPVISGVTGVGVDADGVAEWFTIDGMRLQGAPSHPGIYIVRRGDKASKIVIR